MKGIKSNSQPGNHRKLTKAQKEEITQELNRYQPCDLGYEGRFWSVKVLRDYIMKKFSIIYKTNRSYYQIFKESGFSFHKPLSKDKRQDPQRVAKFESDIKKRLPSIGGRESFWRLMKPD